jgi:hypothetical protein
MFRRVENRKKWTRITLHGWFVRSPQGLSNVRREGRGQRLEKVETLGAGRGPYIAQRRLSVVPTGCRYYRRFPEIETEMSYRYTDPGSVLPGGSGSTDTVSVLPGNASNSNSELISVLSTLCRLYRQFNQILRLIKVLD